MIIGRLSLHASPSLLRGDEGSDCPFNGAVAAPDLDKTGIREPRGSEEVERASG